MEPYVALLRGINVGGRNVIRMADLKTCFEDGGFQEVTTYIQSGNVLFHAEPGQDATLVARIEALLATRFGYEASVVLRSREALAHTVARAPAGFGEDPKAYRYDVLFLKEPLTAEAALAQVDPRPEVDTAHAGPGALYFSRLIARASQSRLTRLTALPVYQQMTIRNWNTTTTLLRMLGGPTP